MESLTCGRVWAWLAPHGFVKNSTVATPSRWKIWRTHCPIVATTSISPWALMMFHESMMSEQVMNFQKTFEKDWTFRWLNEPKQRRLPIWVTSSVSSGSSRTRTRGLANHGFLTLSFSEFPSERKLHFWWGLSCKPADLRLRPKLHHEGTQHVEHIMTCFFLQKCCVLRETNRTKRLSYPFLLKEENLWPIHELQVLSTSSSQNSQKFLWRICFRIWKDLCFGSSTWIFHTKIEAKTFEVLGARYCVRLSPRQSPVAASRSQSQTWWPSRHRLRLSLISTVTCLRWVQISPGVIGGNRIEADYSQDGSMDQNSYPLLVTAKNGVTKNPCFNVAPNFWTFTDLLEVIPPSSAISRTLKKKLGYNVVR